MAFSQPATLCECVRQGSTLTRASPPNAGEIQLWLVEPEASLAILAGALLL